MEAATIAWAKGDVWAGTPFVAEAAGRAGFRFGGVSREVPVGKGATRAVFEGVSLPEGEESFKMTFEVDGKPVSGGRNEDGVALGPIHVTFERID